MQIFHLSVNRKAFQKKANTYYPDLVEVKELAELKDAAQYDHVAALYQDNKRSVENFLRSDCVIMDCDNDKTENKADWIDSAKLAKIFPDVEFYIVFSRNDGRIKMDKESGQQYGPRPRFHVYFPLRQEITDAEQLRGLKLQLLEICPAFDPKATDAARFLFGVKDAKGLPQRGEKCIDEFIADYKPEVIDAEFIELTDSTEIDKRLNLPENIKSGERNSTLFEFAVKLLVRYEIAQAETFYKELCRRCTPPLPLSEINSIWKSAQKTNVVKNKSKKRSLYGSLKRDLCSNDVSDAIKRFNIQARLNIITGKTEVTGLPLNSPFISEDFKNLTPAEQLKNGAQELEIFLTAFLKHEYFSFTVDFLKKILSQYVKYHAFNPVLDMLRATQWDGIDRINYLGQILNITGDAHYMTMLRKWLIQAVAILHNDGNNSLDFALTLKGKQGDGKTELFRVLGMRSDWVRTGVTVDMNNKDTRIEAISCWLCELGELDSTLKKEQTSLKAFITQTVDRYRRPYAAEYEDRPRRTCFCATVNEEEFLRDPTGNRRWAVVTVEKIDLAALHSLKTEWLIQLWRQAYELYLSGETYRLTPEERARNEQLNNKSLVFLPAEQEILEGLQWGVLPELWQECTASGLKENIPALKYIEVRRIGRALAKLAKDDARITVRIKDGCKLYKLPPTNHIQSNIT